MAAKTHYYYSFDRAYTIPRSDVHFDKKIVVLENNRNRNLIKESYDVPLDFTWIDLIASNTITTFRSLSANLKHI